MLPCITLEEHYLSPILFSTGLYSKEKLAALSPAISEKLSAVDDARVKNMDATGVSVQVLSHIPAHPPQPAVVDTNNSLHALIAQHPKRFRGFALLSMTSPAAAAAELRRCVQDLGFVGALVGNHLDDGTFYDAPAYDAVWATAQALDVPVYLHPQRPSDAQHAALYAGLGDRRLERDLACWCWGWHGAVGLHVLRLFAAGVFERFAKLKVIVGHMGEMLPFMLQRIIPFAERWPGAEGRTRGLKTVWDENIWVTTSGMFAMGPMACVLRETRIDRIMYSVDYPLASNEEGAQFLKGLEESGLVDAEALRKIAYLNAEELLGIKAV